MSKMINLDRKYYGSVPFMRRSIISVLSRCLPFIDNKRATLIHRPRYISVMEGSNKYGHHYAMSMHCGSVFTGKPKKFDFLQSIPDGRIVCARCEEEAVKRGNLSAEDICGKHVCTGGVKSFSACCKEINNAPEQSK